MEIFALKIFHKRQKCAFRVERAEDDGFRKGAVQKGQCTQAAFAGDQFKFTGVDAPDQQRRQQSVQPYGFGKLGHGGVGERLPGLKGADAYAFNRNTGDGALGRARCGKRLQRIRPPDTVRSKTIHYIFP